MTATRPRGAPGGSVRLLVAGLVVFALVTADVLAGGPLTRLDRPLSDWALSTGLPGGGWREPGRREIDQLVDLGDREVVGLIVTVAIGWICWRARTLLPLARLVVLSAAIAALVVGLKIAVDRPPPSGVRYDGLLGSYPSGHTATAIVLWGLLAAVTAEHPDAGVSHQVARVLAWVAPVVVMVGMVLRDYHWLSDLIGGAALAVVLVQGERLALRHWRGARGPSQDAGAVAAGLVRRASRVGPGGR